TASNHTYRRLLGWSSQSGTGMPQSMSRVIARGLMSSRMFWLKRITLGRHRPVSSRSSSQCSSSAARAGRSRNQWEVSTNSGVSPLMRETGSIRSVGSSWLPQASHWSPRGPGGGAGGAGALDVPVGRGTAGGRRDGAAGELLDHVAVVPHGHEHVLHHLVVVAGGGTGEQVVGQAQCHQVLDDGAVVAV